MKVLTVNAQSLTPEKLAELECLCEESKYDVVVVSETHLPLSAVRAMRGYAFSRGAEYTGPRGKVCRGVCIYIREGLSFVEVASESDHPALHGVKISGDEGKDLFVGGFYSPPAYLFERADAAIEDVGSSSDDDNDCLHDTQMKVRDNDIRECYAQAQAFAERWSKLGHVLLCGDFNPQRGEALHCMEGLLGSMQCLHWPSTGVDAVSPPWDTETLYEPTCVMPTRGGGTSRAVLDCFLGSPGLRQHVSDFAVLRERGLTGSPHAPVALELEFRAARAAPEKMAPQYSWQWDEAYSAPKEKKVKYVQCLTGCLENWIHAHGEQLQQQRVGCFEQATTELVQCFVVAGTLAFGVRTRRPAGGPLKWFDYELRMMLRRRNALLRRAQRYERDGLAEQAANTRGLYHQMKQEARVMVKLANKRRWNRVVERMEHATQVVFWRYMLRDSRGNTSMPRRVRHPDSGEMEVEPLNKLEAMAAFWSRVVSEADHQDSLFDDDAWEQLKLRVQSLQVDDDPQSPGVTAEAVEAAIKKVHRRKAPGSDGVCDWMIVLANKSDTLRSVLTLLFTALWDTAFVPAQWKFSVFSPIFKKGDPALPQNYRPIALLSVLAKLFSRVINDILYDQLERQGKLPDEQGGFRRFRGSPEMVLATRSVIETRRRRKFATFLSFIDVKRAYDSVSRSGLALALFELGSPGKIWHLVREWYNGDSAAVRMGGLCSLPFPTTLGVRQGDIMSPLLFSCYINGVVEKLAAQQVGVDLGDGYPRLAILLFADDMLCFAENGDDLQRLLDALSAHMNSLRLRVSTGMNQMKSAVMVYGREFCNKTADLDREYVLCGLAIPIVHHYRYLGVVLQDDGKWTMQAAQMRSALGVCVHRLIRAGMHRDGLNPRRGRQLIKIQMNPILEYASGVFILPAIENDKLQSAWQKGVRAAFGVPRFASIAPLLGDLDLVESSVVDRQRLYRLTMLHRVLGYSPSRIVRRCVMLWKHVRQDATNWWVAAWRAMEILGFRVDKTNDEQVAAFARTKRQKWLEAVKAAAYRKARTEWLQKLRAVDEPHLWPYWCCVRDVPICPPAKREHVRLASYLEDKHKRRRQFFAMCRAGSLPLQAGKQSSLAFRCGGAHSSPGPLCFMCEQSSETMDHFLWSCPAYEDLRKESELTFPTEALPRERIYSSPKRWNLYLHHWFNQWQLRIQAWRRGVDPEYPFLGGTSTWLQL